MVQLHGVHPLPRLGGVIEILEFWVFWGGQNILGFRGVFPMRGVIYSWGRSVDSLSIFPF